MIMSHVPSDCFLRLLPGTPALSGDVRVLRLEEKHFGIFSGLKQKLEWAVQVLKAARRKGVQNILANEVEG